MATDKLDGFFFVRNFNKLDYHDFFFVAKVVMILSHEITRVESGLDVNMDNESSVNQFIVYKRVSREGGILIVDLTISSVDLP